MNDQSADPIRIRSEEILSDDWALLKKVTFDLQGQRRRLADPCPSDL